MEKLINLGVLAHVDAGKTTVTEGLLVHCGAKAAMGRVDHGTTTTDSMSLERQRGMTIRATTVSFTYQNTKINLLDTPGHMDFFAEVERSLTVLDGVVLVLSAREGVQPQTRVIFRKLRAMGLPTILFINKIDRIGVSTADVLADIREHLTSDIAVLQHVTGEGTREATPLPLALDDGLLQDTILEQDDALLTRYLADEPIPAEACEKALWGAVKRSALYPVLFGAALHDVGIAPLLDAITASFGAPPAPEGPLSAMIYKVEWGPTGHKQLYARLFSGVLPIRGRVEVVGREEPLHVRGLLAARDGQLCPTDAVVGGDIGIILDAHGVRCGDWLGTVTPRKGVSAPATPLLSVGVAPASPAQRATLLNALTRLSEEDPLLDLVIRPDTDEITIRLYGALQREIIEALLIERFSLEAVFSPLMTRFAEKPRQAAEADIRIWKDGNLHEAGIALRLSPLPAGSGNRYETKVSFGDLEKTYQNGVEDGVWKGLSEGLGTEIVDTCVEFIDMDYSSVTSTPADYRRLAPLVLQKALKAADIVRLEPWLSYALTAPVAQQKRIMSALTGMRATLGEVIFDEEEMSIRGEAPLDTTKGFAVELLSMTQGKGVFEAEFLEYREV